MNKDLVAFFVPSMVGGGAERVMLNLAIGMRERGLRVDMVLVSAKGPYLDKIPPDIRVIDLGASRILTSLPGLVRYLKRERPLGLICALANVVAIWAKCLARVETRVVPTTHNTTSIRLSNARRLGFRQKLKRKLSFFLERLFYSKAYALVAVSEGVADDIAQLTKIDRSRIKVIYNPAITPDIERDSKSEVEHRWLTKKEVPVLISAGRLTEQKDFGNLLRAFKLILKERPAKLIILGEGEERSSLENLIVDLGLTDDVDMPGFVDNPFSYLANADLFVLPSAWEGFGMVIVEALAVGTPVVSTDCPSGPREILQDGRLGRLVPVGDSEMLADAIIATLDEPHKTVTPDDLKAFTRDAAVDAYLNLLDGRDES